MSLEYFLFHHLGGGAYSLGGTYSLALTDGDDSVHSR